MSLTVLITGFEPFGLGHSRKRNVSGEAVTALAAKTELATLLGIKLVARVLPVTFEEAPRLLHGALMEHRPDIVIATGIHGRETFRLEAVARNRDNSTTADNNDTIRLKRPIEPVGDATIPTGLPLPAIERILKRYEFPTEISGDAGGFLCNHVFYRLRHWHRGALTEAPGVSGFIHLPPLAEAATPFTFDDLVAGLQWIVEVTIQSVRKRA